MISIYSIFYYFLLFMIYSIGGWLIEVIAIGIEKRKFINRGFFIGPYCPIYGFSAVIMILLLDNYKNDPFALFILAAFVCTFFEYVTSFVMEKLFQARWWDYSRKTFNINGRVCLENSVIFGVFGVLLVCIVNPFVTGLLSEVSHGLIVYISSILLIAFVVDNIVSFNIISKFKTTACSVIKDNTEEISEKTREILRKKSILGRRLVNAFPNVKSLLPEIKAKYEEKKRQIKEKIH